MAAWLLRAEQPGVVRGFVVGVKMIVVRMPMITLRDARKWPRPVNVHHYFLMANSRTPESG